MALIPFRRRVLTAIATTLETNIVAGPDYNFTLVGKVFRGRRWYGTNDGLPLVSILEPPIADNPIPVPREVAHGNNTWPLLIQGFVEDDPMNPTDPAHDLLADVKRCLSIEKERNYRVESRANGVPNPFDMGKMRTTSPDEFKSNYVEAIETIGQGVVRPSDEGVSDKAYFWLNLTLKIQEDIKNPFV